MSIPLKLVAANDTVGALIALADALAGRQAVFITAPETNGLMPEVHGLPNEVADDIALIVESSGSTGTPKRIWLSREALLASAHASNIALSGAEASSESGTDAASESGTGASNTADAASGAQWLLALPINYIAGINVLVRSLVAETQPVIMNTALPFTPDAFARSANFLRAKRRYVSLVPTQLQRLIQAAATDDFLLGQLRRFDAILVGGQAIDAELLLQATDYGLKIVRTYGSAETAGGCVYDGLPISGVKLGFTSDGRIKVAGPTLAQNVADDAGWYATNDLGELDNQGVLKVLGRSNRVLNSGGIKVSLDLIEEAVRAIGGVVEVAAIAVSDNQWGERAAVIYVGSPEVADFIAADALSQLGPAAKPVRVIRVDAIPRLVSGKPDYQTLKSQFA